MKTLTKIVAASMILLTMNACSKDMNQKASPVASSLSDKSMENASSCTATWLGSYIAPNEPLVYVPTSDFIFNGHAQLRADSANPYPSYFFTTLELPMPSCQNISADSLEFKVDLENPDSLPGANTDYDVNLFITGTTDTAHVTFIAYRPQFTSLQVGTYGVTGSSALLHLFETWTEVNLETHKDSLTANINGKAIQSISYKGTRLGRLQKIDISFKGPGKVNQVQLFNSRTKKLLMLENFNLKGKSDVIFYQ